MPAYAVGHLERVSFNEDIREYLRRIDATLLPFHGRFLVHAGRTEVLEGPWRGPLIVIEFPDMERARAWYTSAEYQAILPLRTANAEGVAILVEGVPEGYRAEDAIAKAAQRAR